MTVARRSPAPGRSRHAAPRAAAATMHMTKGAQMRRTGERGRTRGCRFGRSGAARRAPNGGFAALLHRAGAAARRPVRRLLPGETVAGRAQAVVALLRRMSVPPRDGAAHRELVVGPFIVAF